jgi:hypothetical protein
MESTVSALYSLPELLSSNDLVTLGLFSSPDSAYLARMRGNSPDFIKVGRKILYPKFSVIQFIEYRLQRGHKPQRLHQTHSIKTVIGI